MILPVSDARSNPNDQLAHAVQVLGRSQHRLKVFKAIYAGKRRIKSVSEIAKATGLSRIRVLQEGGKLSDNQIVRITKKGGETAYEKDRFYGGRRNQILKLASSPENLKRLPTKVRPHVSAFQLERVTIPRRSFNAKQITIDDIDSFRKVRKIKTFDQSEPIPESVFKHGIQQVVEELGTFKDWGGERNDLFTTRIRYLGRRCAAAFAFKGPGHRGKLTPSGMGKNGDQIQRLFFGSPAEIFFVQYWGQIDQSLVEQMGAFAVVKSVAGGGTKVLYGIIDQRDCQRLVAAYSSAFRAHRVRTGERTSKRGPV